MLGEIALKDCVLIVDSDAICRATLRLYLEGEGIRIIETVDGEDALRKFENEVPDLVIADIAIGQPNGFELCRQIRKISEVPIIFLTARIDEIDEAMCFSAGANDYIKKPVAKAILVLRVLNQLARKHRSNPIDATTIRAANLTLDLLSRELKVDETLVAITRTEFEFIHLLMEYPDRVFTRAQVSTAVGISDKFSGDHLLDTHASRLRLKIKAAGGPRAIAAVRGVGYRFI